MIPPNRLSKLTTGSPSATNAATWISRCAQLAQDDLRTREPTGQEVVQGLAPVLVGDDPSHERGDQEQQGKSLRSGELNERRLRELVNLIARTPATMIQLPGAELDSKQKEKNQAIDRPRQVIETPASRRDRLVP